MSDTLSGMADELLAQVSEKVLALKATPEMTEVLRLHRALNGVEAAIPRPTTPLAALFGLASEETPVTALRKAQLKPWEFTGLKPLEAAKKFLKIAGEPRSIQEIVTAIREHGGNPGSPDHLKTSLTRSTVDVVKVNDDMYGLLEHFPELRRASRWSKKRSSGSNGGGAATGSEEDQDEEQEELDTLDHDGMKQSEEEDEAEK